jgi:hypothetical protein
MTFGVTLAFDEDELERVCIMRIFARMTLFSSRSSLAPCTLYGFLDALYPRGFIVSDDDSDDDDGQKSAEAEDDDEDAVSAKAVCIMSIAVMPAPAARERKEVFFMKKGRKKEFVGQYTSTFTACE